VRRLKAMDFRFGSGLVIRISYSDYFFILALKDSHIIASSSVSDERERVHFLELSVSSETRALRKTDASNSNPRIPRESECSKQLPSPSTYRLRLHNASTHFSKDERVQTIVRSRNSLFQCSISSFGNCV
jgi:hypothetical protein